MRIALLIPSLKKFGPIVFTDYLVRSMQDKVSYIEVFYFNSHSEDDVLVDFVCKKTKLNFFEKYDFSSFDIVHSTMLIPDLYLALKGVYKKSIVCSSMHNYIYNDLSMLYPRFKAKVMTNIWYYSLSKFTNFIVSSDDMKRYYQQKLHKKSNLNVIAYGIPQPELNPHTQVDEHEDLVALKSRYTVLGSCGLIIKRKGFNQLVDLLVIDERLAVVLIGDGPEFKALNKYAKEKGVSERFRILGFKRNSEQYYKYFDIFVMCSYSEGYGLAMLEALALSLPLVCSNLDIYNPIFNTPSVALFEPGNINTLKSAIDFALKNAKAMSIDSYSLYENNFSLDSMGSAHVDYYKNLIKLAIQH